MINVTAAIIMHGSKILSVRRAQNMHLAGFWEFPGGKVETGETLKACLKRELVEELGIDVDIHDYVGQSTYDYGNKQIRLHAYVVPVESDQFALTDHDESKWLDYDQLDDMQWAPADIPIINQLKTYLFYRVNANNYIEETSGIDLTESLRSFSHELPNNADVLDVGCGSGRDALYFMKQGYDVVATEMVSEMAEAASSRISQEVLVRSCFNLEFMNKFDGIWASASLLHCPKSEFHSATQNLSNVLRNNGIVYISLKQGEGESLDSYGRYFSYYSEEDLMSLFDDMDDLTITRLWHAESHLRDRKQVWINLLARKV